MPLLPEDGSWANLPPPSVISFIKQNDVGVDHSLGTGELECSDEMPEEDCLPEEEAGHEPHVGLRLPNDLFHVGHLRVVVGRCQASRQFFVERHSVKHSSAFYRVDVGRQADGIGGQ